MVSVTQPKRHHGELANLAHQHLLATVSSPSVAHRGIMIAVDQSPRRIRIPSVSHHRRMSSFQDFTRRFVASANRCGCSRGNIAPPLVQRAPIASKFHAHAARKFDPIGKAMVSDCNQDGNVSVQGALNQIGQASSITLALAEPVYDHEICAGLDRISNPGARALESIEVKPAAFCAGVEILGQQQLFTAVNQLRRQARIGALTGLYHADSTKASLIQVRREGAQDGVGVLMLVIDKGGQVALGRRTFWLSLELMRPLVSLFSYIYHGFRGVPIANGGPNRLDYGFPSIYSDRYNELLAELVRWISRPSH